MSKHVLFTFFDFVFIVAQLLGIVMRADVPLPFDLTSTFWKSFLNDPLTFDDIKEVDVVLYKYLKAIKEVMI